MFRSATLIFFIISSIQILSSQILDPVAIGSKQNIHSNILEEDRSYWISLPESYDRKDLNYKEYPILVVLDGHAHFKAISGVVNYMSSGYNGNRRIPEMIVVGIQNVNRNRDFTPDKIVTKRENVFGGGDKFLSFLEKELIPKLDQEYRTSSYRILYGHSLGGLLATHTYMKGETLFNSFIAVDPSLGSWDAETMDKKLEVLSPESFKRYIYIATANWGKRNFKNRDRHVRLYEALNRKYAEKFPAELEYFENEDHGSVPVIAFHNGINSIFKGYGISYRDVKSKEHLLSHFAILSDRLSYKFPPPESLVNRIAYNKLRGKGEEDKLKAIDFFKINTTNFPLSYNAFDSLAEAYEASGDKTKAIQNYERSLELNPENDNAIVKLAILKTD